MARPGTVDRPTPDTTATGTRQGVDPDPRRVFAGGLTARAAREWRPGEQQRPHAGSSVDICVRILADNQEGAGRPRECETALLGGAYHAVVT